MNDLDSSQDFVLYSTSVLPFCHFVYFNCTLQLLHVPAVHVARTTNCQLLHHHVASVIAKKNTPPSIISTLILLYPAKAFVLTLTLKGLSEMVQILNGQVGRQFPHMRVLSGLHQSTHFFTMECSLQQRTNFFYYLQCYQFLGDGCCVKLNSEKIILDVLWQHVRQVRMSIKGVMLCKNRSNR